MVGLGQSFKNSRLVPYGEIFQPSHLCSSPPEVAPAGFCVFSSDPDPHPESLYNFGSSRSLRDHFLVKTRADVGCINR